MINAIEELFLSEYFLMQTILSKILTDSKEMFFTLGKIFLLSDTKIYLLYRLSEREDVKSIKTENDFKRHMRIKQYLQMSGSNNLCIEEVEHIKNIKGNAILAATQLKLKSDGEATQNIIYATVSNAANQGVVPALRIMGFLQCEGIVIEQNFKIGISNLSKSADWNDIVSALALLHYCKETREYNIARLYMLTENTPFASLHNEAVKEYQVFSNDEIKEVKLLEKAFNYSVLKREVYDPKYAKIIYSEILKYEERDRLIISESKESVSMLADLPLNLPKFELHKMNFSVFQQVHLVRAEEQKEILKNIKNADLVGQDIYQPLCLCSDSDYILDMYIELISKISNIDVAHINISDLTDYDLEPTPNNIFIRNINEGRSNCFILDFRGNIRLELVEYAVNFLKAANRAKFHLNKPNITIDLSNLLPICVCDERNFDYLGACCEVVRLKEVSKEEMPQAIEHILVHKKKLYGLTEIKLQKNHVDKLCCEKVEAVEKILDYAVREHRGESGKVEIAEADLKLNHDKNKSNKIGFGCEDI